MQVCLEYGFADPRSGIDKSIGAQWSGLAAAWSSKDADVTKLPDPNALVVPLVKWGRPDVLFTPAYWSLQAKLCAIPSHNGAHRIGATFREEVVACLVGGYGIPADVGIAAFHALRSQAVFELSSVSERYVFRVLSQPLCLASGGQVRYRFAQQKSRYIAEFLGRFDELPSNSDMKATRDWLTQFNGIGPKTASWVVRNWFDSDDVAIIDVHLHRAGLLAGFFRSDDDPAKNYREMEHRYLAFAEALQVRASLLDALIWWQMRRAGRLVAQALRNYNHS